MDAMPRGCSTGDVEYASDDRRLSRWVVIALFAHASLFVVTAQFARRAVDPAARPLFRPLSVLSAVEVQKADPDPPRAPAAPDPPAELPAARPTTAWHAKAHADPRPAVDEPVAVGSPALSAIAESLVNQAAAVVTGPAIAEAPAFASGAAKDATFGLVAGDGQGTDPTMDGRASLGGGGRGRGVSGAAKGGGKGRRDKSRTASAMGGFTDECDFPREANDANINRAVVTVVVTVEPDGRPSKVVVQEDPGHGFGAAARSCALYTLMYATARDAEGRAIRGDTPPTRIRFSR